MDVLLLLTLALYPTATILEDHTVRENSHKKIFRWSFYWRELLRVPLNKKAAWCGPQCSGLRLRKLRFEFQLFHS